ncbi:hypothetical protein BJQ94_18140 [Cryobacterium sp. SO2]|uniref:hypothetical protein n=1 Tax=Cryobacterium sp. SO2 TaxID=1897060 RepID=UPI00223E05EE|nr:hypothetical protein [Cryobacterium sp. SO2]WEO77245.1 hypothetical protein BJQ94_18140 [Cryobacterium sp. SO2]
MVEGNSLGVTMRITALRPALIELADISLIRKVNYTYGRGNIYGGVFPARERSTELVTAVTVPAPGVIPAGQTRVLSQTLSVPGDGPASVRGDLIDVGWSVRCVLKAAGGQIIKRERLIDVQSWGQTSATDIGHPPVGEHLGQVALEFIALSSRILEPGTPLTGVLRLRPHAELNTRGVRVQLVRCEEVWGGPGQEADPDASESEGYRHSEAVMSAVTVGAAGTLVPGTVVDLPFAVETPAGLPAPSLSIGNLHVRWEVRAVVDLPLRSDPRLSLDLLAVTASRQPLDSGRQGALDTD